MPVCTWVCALSFGRCRMSKFFLLVYLDFFEILRRSLDRKHANATCALLSFYIRHYFLGGGRFESASFF